MSSGTLSITKHLSAHDAVYLGCSPHAWGLRKLFFPNVRAEEDKEVEWRKRRRQLSPKDIVTQLSSNISLLELCHMTCPNCKEPAKFILWLMVIGWAKIYFILKKGRIDT